MIFEWLGVIRGCVYDQKQKGIMPLTRCLQVIIIISLSLLLLKAVDLLQNYPCRGEENEKTVKNLCVGLLVCNSRRIAAVVSRI